MIKEETAQYSTIRSCWNAKKIHQNLSEGRHYFYDTD
jgi:hypothetical protein